MPNKKCSKCKKTKPISDFSPDKRRQSGLKSECRECKRIADKQYRDNPLYRDRIKVAQRRKDEKRNGRIPSKRTPRNPVGRNADNYGASLKRWHNKNPEAHRAHDVVYRASERGEFPKAHEKRCHECGKQAAHYHHFLGYEPEHWFDVVPLCNSCHRKRHSLEQKKGD